MSALIKLAGMMLPGKHPASPAFLQAAPAAILSGSAMKMGFPVLSMLCEKSPFRSAAVGTVICRSLSAGWTVGQISWEKKKKTLALVLLKWSQGRMTGPPALYPMVLKRLIGLGKPSLLLKNVLA